MSFPQTLTDEQAAAIWSGDTASILDYGQTGNADAGKTEDAIQTNQPTEPDNVEAPVSDDEISNIWKGKDEDDEESTESQEPDNQDTSKQTPATTGDATPEVKRGRKPSDLVNMVNQLVEEEILFGYEQGEVKSIEEAKELIRENLNYKEEKAFETKWKVKLESYSPQVQAIIHYAEKGGQDITPLLSAIAEVEKSSEINIEEETGQEEVVRQVLKLKGFDDEDIKDEIETLKDLDKLKAKATKFLPELNKAKGQQIQMMLQEQEERDRQASEAAAIYVQTIQQTLDKDQVGDVKLKREDKYKLMEALAEPKYRSLNGYRVNEFVKRLEDMQFGKKADYDHFLNLVHFAVDKQGFMEKLKEAIKTEVTSQTVKTLKTAKSSSANSPQDSEPSEPRRNTIQRSGFKNPYSK
jgi:hypothetical protein